MLLDEATKFVITEIAKELDFSFFLKTKSLVERYKKESEKIVLEVIEVDSTLLKWEEFRSHLKNINLNVYEINSGIKKLIDQ